MTQAADQTGTPAADTGVCHRQRASFGTLTQVWRRVKNVPQMVVVWLTFVCLPLGLRQVSTSVRLCSAIVPSPFEAESLDRASDPGVICNALRRKRIAPRLILRADRWPGHGVTYAASQAAVANFKGSSRLRPPRPSRFGVGPRPKTHILQNATFRAKVRTKPLGCLSRCLLRPRSRDRAAKNNGDVNHALITALNASVFSRLDVEAKREKRSKRHQSLTAGCHETATTSPKPPRTAWNSRQLR